MRPEVQLVYSQPALALTPTYTSYKCNSNYWYVRPLCGHLDLRRPVCLDKTRPMAEQRDDKPRLPLAGLFALLGMISGFLVYEGISLKTSRPIDREIATNISLKKGIVQSRLWQDPFEALDAHKALERKLSGKPEEKNGQHTLDKLIEVIEQSGVSSLRILPVFVDGSPYVNGAESRLNDRYAVVSALGAAGYEPSPANISAFSNGAEIRQAHRKTIRKMCRDETAAGNGSGRGRNRDAYTCRIVFPARKTSG